MWRPPWKRRVRPGGASRGFERISQGSAPGGGYPLSPEYMKLSTNRRWKRTNRTSSGRMTITVPAAMRFHWAPYSAAWVKEASPTVTVRARTVSVMMSGHRNSL